MKVHDRRLGIAAALAFVAAGFVAASCGGGGGGGGAATNNPPTSPSPPPGAPSGNSVTVTIRANGQVEPRDVSVALGDTVRFVNEDGRTHQPQSNPHLQHTDCPSLNRIGQVAPGGSSTSDPFTVEKVCGYHDHLNPDATGLAGVIRVNGAIGDGGPIYVKH
jgi:plastocyanin